MLLTPSRLHRSKAFTVPGLPGQYPLTVYLPPGYGQTDARYPVAYMFDGQNLFQDQGSYSGGWYMHETLDALAAQGKRVPIVVGIHHGGASRTDELSPWGIGRGHQGKLETLLTWMIGPLAQMVGEEMRILTGPANTMVGGSSLGGLAALYATSKYPQVYGRALVMSPSLWVHGGAIFEVVRKASYGPDSRIYLDCGGREGRGQTMVAAERMAALLAHKGMGDRFMWRPDAKGVHNERNWRRRLPKAMRFMYKS
jgi:predicted alpha/beta superfamily hydrolase